MMRGYADGAVRYICAFVSIYVRCLVLICIDLPALESLSVNTDLQITNVKCFLSTMVNLIPRPFLFTSRSGFSQSQGFVKFDKKYWKNAYNYNSKGI
jgi:hypothetical protein